MDIIPAKAGISIYKEYTPAVPEVIISIFSLLRLTFTSPLPDTSGKSR